MGLFKRVGDIVSANLNEMVEKFEDPEKMLKQAVREMETAINSSMDGAAKVVANAKLLTKQLDEHRRQAEAWRQRAEKAVRQNDDDTARHALLRKAEHEKLIAALDDQRTADESASLKLRRQIDAMRVRLAEARRKLVTLAARHQAAQARKQLAGDIGGAAGDGLAFSKFERICERVEQTEAEADALLELAGNDWQAEDLNPDIEAELDALKRQSTPSS